MCRIPIPRDTELAVFHYRWTKIFRFWFSQELHVCFWKSNTIGIILKRKQFVSLFIRLVICMIIPRYNESFLSDMYKASHCAKSVGLFNFIKTWQSLFKRLNQLLNILLKIYTFVIQSKKNASNQRTFSAEKASLFSLYCRSWFSWFFPTKQRTAQTPYHVRAKHIPEERKKATHVTRIDKKIFVTATFFVEKNFQLSLTCFALDKTNTNKCVSSWFFHIFTMCIPRRHTSREVLTATNKDWLIFFFDVSQISI